MASEATVLIIDDDSDYRASTRALLESKGYKVLEASSGDEGRRMAIQHGPNLIVVDILMESPVEGYHVVQALHHGDAGGATANIPIIMVSSVQTDPASLFPMADDTPMITPDAYFTKPLQPAPFLACVKRMLGEPR